MTLKSAPLAGRPHVVIIGGGVVGLSCAISLLSHPVHPYAVTLIAADLPDLDAHTYSPSGKHGQPAAASYASAWAGAHHVSSADTEVQRTRDQRTFETLCKLERALAASPWSDKEHRPLFWVHQVELRSRGARYDTKSVDWYPDVSGRGQRVNLWSQMSDKRSLPFSSPAVQYQTLTTPDTEFGCSLSTFDIIVPKYLPMLFAYMLSLGGRALRRKVESVDEAVRLATAGSRPELAGEDVLPFLTVDAEGTFRKGDNAKVAPPSLVVATPGLGAKKLLADEGVHAVRGQTLLVRAPWCTSEAVLGHTGAKHEWCGMTLSPPEQDESHATYVIPRGDGTLIVGGTRLPDDYDVAPRSETTEEILRRALPLMPALARPEKQEDVKQQLKDGPGSGPLSDAVDIVDVNVGLRPARHRGIRIEAADSRHSRVQLPVVYSYGFGGIGYQSSWGAAFETRTLVDRALGQKPAPPGATWADLDSGHLAHLPSPAVLLGNAKHTR